MCWTICQDDFRRATDRILSALGYQAAVYDHRALNGTAHIPLPKEAGVSPV